MSGNLWLECLLLRYILQYLLDDSENRYSYEFGMNSLYVGMARRNLIRIDVSNDEGGILNGPCLIKS